MHQRLFVFCAFALLSFLSVQGAARSCAAPDGLLEAFRPSSSPHPMLVGFAKDEHQNIVLRMLPFSASARNHVVLLLQSTHSDEDRLFEISEIILKATKGASRLPKLTKICAKACKELETGSGAEKVDLTAIYIKLTKRRMIFISTDVYGKHLSIHPLFEEFIPGHLLTAIRCSNYRPTFSTENMTGLDVQESAEELQKIHPRESFHLIVDVDQWRRLIATKKKWRTI
jgi:hypothetical protein